LAVSTERIGLVGTATTSFNSPFNLVRRLGSLDLISRGRAGWNVVTTGDAGTAGNYGLDEHYDYDTRYGRAQEFVELARALWDSYEDDAFVRDRETGVFLDRLVVMPGVEIGLGDTDEEAREIEAVNNDRDHTFQAALGEFGRAFGWHDFTQYDVDAPFPAEVLKYGERSFYTQAKSITQRA